jgi:hypothetical protein
MLCAVGFLYSLSIIQSANIQQFPDIPAVSAEILALRVSEGTKGRAWLNLLSPRRCDDDT